METTSPPPPPPKKVKSFPEITLLDSEMKQAVIYRLKSSVFQIRQGLTVVLLSLLLLFVLAGEITAQTTTLVSNTGETADGNITSTFGTQFTTGANSTGYTISSVDIYITSAAPVVTIRADGTDPTGTVIATLTAPTTITANAVNTFTAPVNTVLAANTIYWLRVDATSTARVSLTNSDNETGATGWSISNSGEIRAGSSWVSNFASIRFAINGQANPLPPNAPTNLTATAGNGQVTLSWADPSNSQISKYQYRQGSGSPLVWGSWTDIGSSDATTTSHTVTSLTNGTEYSFQVRAFVGSTAGTESAIVTATPVAPPVVSIARQGSAVVTEGGSVVFRVTASRTVIANLTVNLSVADAPHADFVDTPNEGSDKSVTVMAGQATANFTIPTTGGDSETTDEPSSNVTVTVNTGTGYMVGSDSIATVKVTDDDPTTVVLTTPDAKATEGSTSDRATLRLTLNRALRSGERLQVPLGFSGGTLDTDFTMSLSGSPAGVTLSDSTVTFSGNVAAVSATIAEVLLSASEDADTADETVTVSIPSGTAFTPRLTATGLDGGATGSRTGDGQITLIDTTPEKPVNFTAIAGDRQVTLNWTDPSNSDITGYQFQQKEGSGDYGNWTIILGSTAATVSHTVTGLTNGTVYTLRIRAVAGTTNGVISDEAMATPNAVPTVMNRIPDQTATVGTAFNYQFLANTFSDADNDPLDYSATFSDDSALPTWLAFAKSTRTFSGTPQAGDAGTIMVKVTADDGKGGMVSDSFDITVGEGDAPLGISTAENISIYPNPASGYFKLAHVSAKLNGVILVSTSGKAVRHYPALEDGRYDVSALGEGIFFVFTEGDKGQRYAGRIVIKRGQN